MKNQINLLSQIQELVLTRDEHRQSGDGSHLDTLDDAIANLSARLDPPIQELFARLRKKDHVVVAPMYNGCCAVCGMQLPISQIQQVRMGKTIQVCANCGRVLLDEDADMPHVPPPAKGPRPPRKTGIARFSAEELMIPSLKGKTAEACIRELAERMAAHNFVTNADKLVTAAMEREAILTTSMGNGIAFPHVRGVEGGGLTLALGISKNGVSFERGGEKVHFIFFSAIPVAVSAFYLRLMANLAATFSSEKSRDALRDAADATALWKTLQRETRRTVQ